ncbi:MAG: hypothetical protein ACAI37_18325 [Chthoniobacter sp.]
MAAHAAPSKVSYSGGDGSSFAKAVVIHGATEQTGVDAEYGYLAKHYPGSRSGKQSLTAHGGRHFDLLEFTTADGKKRQIYFDITEFFGKF